MKAANYQKNKQGIFTKQILFFFENDKATANVDDIVETINHFSCFDYMLGIAHEPLTEKHVKEFHQILKANTSDSKKPWFCIGEYKQRPNMVGGLATSLPSDGYLPFSTG